MRGEKEMLELILAVAQKDERVRVVGLNGSRVNPNAPQDAFQDYDVVYLVTDMGGFLSDPAWIDVFGRRIILQTPEAMALFPATLGGWFTWLMLFEDGNRIDLMMIPLEELDKYLANDKLTRILLDKDGRVPPLPPPSDEDYWIKRPTARGFGDCCNEFWWLATYVAKGLCRGELPYAVDHLALVRQMLFTMLSWEVGIDSGFDKSIGKNFKYLPRCLPPQQWAAVAATYRNDTPHAVWTALADCCRLFRASSQSVAAHLGFAYPDYDKKVTPYIDALQKRHSR